MLIKSQEYTVPRLTSAIYSRARDDISQGVFRDCVTYI